MTPQQEALDRLCGKCSGIPDCCIEYFVGEWLSSGCDRIKRPDLPSWGYVPCRNCVTSGNRVVVKICRKGDCYCGMWKWKF